MAAFSHKISGGGGGGGNNNNKSGDIRTGCRWSVFDLVKPFPPTPSPGFLMADINAAIAATEHARATAFLLQQPQEEQQVNDNDNGSNLTKNQVVNINIHDPRLADEAYKAACDALASGRHSAAVRSLRIAIASCPPDKASALAKLQSLMAIAESQLQQKQKQQQQLQQLREGS